MTSAAPEVDIYPNSKNTDMAITESAPAETHFEKEVSKALSAATNDNQASRSSEIFISDDNIINTQESNGGDPTDTDIYTSSKNSELVAPEDVHTKDNPEEELILQPVDGTLGATNVRMHDISGIVGDSQVCKQPAIMEVVELISDDEANGGITNVKNEVEDNMIQERRRSDRLKKDTAVTTVEKIEKVAKKRNLEGNSANSNVFSALPVDEIVQSAADMGVVVHNDDLETFDLLKTLELARDDLYKNNVN